MADLLVNDSYIGKVEDPKSFIQGFKEKRRSGKIDNSYGIYFDESIDIIYIDNTPGKIRRPVIIAENGVSRLNKNHIAKLKKEEWGFKDLLKNGIIEYIDAAEEENCLIALYEEDLTQEHTHLEISPLLMFSINTGMIPYGNYNEGSRMMIAQKATKQAIGVYTKNFLNMFQTDRNILVNPQKPLTKTFINDLFDFDDHSAGQNLTVAVMSYEGYNIEDGIIFNQSSVERGVQRSFYYKIYESSEVKYPGGMTDRIGVPGKEVKGYMSEEDYRYLEDDGIIYQGEEVKEGDVIIGKISPPRFIEEVEGFGQFFNLSVDSSIVVKEHEGGVVSNVLVYENATGDKAVNIQMRDERVPIVGDKFTTRHSQKGVIGALFKQSEMPFTENGIIPDVVFSPHSIPSRKTVGHVLEMLAGKVAALRGEQVDGTTFDGMTEEELREYLKEAGLNSSGTEYVYDPKTGKRIESEIFVGNSYYHKLKYQVENKIQSRATGSVQLLTRQPTEGRARGGGLRLGEMEKDVMIAHGSSLLLKERFSPDQTHGLVCRGCGYMTDPYFFRYYNKCPTCNSTKFDKVEIAYAFKLLINQLRSMGIKITFEVKDKFYTED